VGNAGEKAMAFELSPVLSYTGVRVPDEPEKSVKVRESSGKSGMVLDALEYQSARKVS